MPECVDPHFDPSVVTPDTKEMADIHGSVISPNCKIAKTYGSYVDYEADVARICSECSLKFFHGIASTTGHSLAPPPQMMFDDPLTMLDILLWVRVCAKLALECTRAMNLTPSTIVTAPT